MDCQTRENIKESSKVVAIIFAVVQTFGAFIAFLGSACGEVNMGTPFLRYQVPFIPGIYAGNYAQRAAAGAVRWMREPAVKPPPPVDRSQGLEKP